MSAAEVSIRIAQCSSTESSVMHSKANPFSNESTIGGVLQKTTSKTSKSIGQINSQVKQIPKEASKKGQAKLRTLNSSAIAAKNSIDNVSLSNLGHRSFSRKTKASLSTLNVGEFQESALPPPSIEADATFLPPSSQRVKFSGKGLPSQTRLTPIMFQRAVSLRGPATRSKSDGAESQPFLEVPKRNVELRRAFSDRRDEVFNNRSNANSINEETLSNDPCNSTLSEGSKSYSGSRDEFDVSEFLKKNLDESRIFMTNCSQPMENDLIFFFQDLQSYEKNLSELVCIYEQMKTISPEIIRQHFDLPLLQIVYMLDLQRRMNRNIGNSENVIRSIAEEFSREELTIYQQYMVMSPKILSSIKKYQIHIESNYPGLKDLLLKPSTRLNFCVNILSSLLQYAKYDEKYALKGAIKRVKEIKQNANTEMTLKSITNSPVALRLAGKILHVGELSYMSGPLPKKIYYIVVFQNILVFTISKISYFEYVAHYRIGQLVSVERDIEKKLSVTIASSVQGPIELHSFKSTVAYPTGRWYYLLEEILFENKASYEICETSQLSEMTVRNTGKCIPLSIWQVFPFLRGLFPLSPSDDGYTLAELCLTLIREEESYVQKLTSVLLPETLPPPNDILNLIKRILHLHERLLLPELQEAMKASFHAVINVFIDFIGKLSDYQTYLVKRSFLTTALPDGIKARHYVLPVQHLEFYVHWTKQLKFNDKYSQQANYAIETLLSYITDAKVRLLHEALPSCCLDFFRTGELQKGGYLQVSSKLLNKRIIGGNYLVLLFEKVILLTKPNPPTYRLLLDIWLDQANIIGPCDDQANTFKLEYYNGKSKGPVSIEFKAKDCLSKTTWLQAIHRQWGAMARELKDSLIQATKVTYI